jgi:hypothetical protein
LENIMLVSSVSIVSQSVLSVTVQGIDARISDILNNQGQEVLIDRMREGADFAYRAHLALINLRGILTAPVSVNENSKEVGAADLIKAYGLALHSDSKANVREYGIKIARLARRAHLAGHDVFAAESVSALTKLATPAKESSNEHESAQSEREIIERAEKAAVVMQAVQEKAAQEEEQLRQKSIIDGLADKLESAQRALQSSADKLAASEKARIDADVAACLADEARVSMHVRLEYLESVLTPKQRAAYQAKFA